MTMSKRNQLELLRAIQAAPVRPKDTAIFITGEVVTFDSRYAEFLSRIDPEIKEKFYDGQYMSKADFDTIKSRIKLDIFYQYSEL